MNGDRNGVIAPDLIDKKLMTTTTTTMSQIKRKKKTMIKESIISTLGRVDLMDPHIIAGTDTSAGKSILPRTETHVAVTMMIAALVMSIGILGISKRTGAALMMNIGLHKKDGSITALPMMKIIQDTSR